MVAKMSVDRTLRIRHRMLRTRISCPRAVEVVLKRTKRPC